MMRRQRYAIFSDIVRWGRGISAFKSIGNKVTGPFTDTLTIEKLTEDELILKKGRLTLRYHKQ